MVMGGGLQKWLLGKNRKLRVWGKEIKKEGKREYIPLVIFKFQISEKPNYFR